MSLPDGAEYWWLVKGHLREPRKPHPMEGVRCCPICGHGETGSGTLKRLRRHYKTHGLDAAGVDFPLMYDPHRRGPE